MVDLRGLEPLTSTLPVSRAPSCATGPNGALAPHVFYQRTGTLSTQKQVRQTFGDKQNRAREPHWLPYNETFKADCRADVAFSGPVWASRSSYSRVGLVRSLLIAVPIRSARYEPRVHFIFATPLPQRRGQKPRMHSGLGLPSSKPARRR